MGPVERGTRREIRKVPVEHRTGGLAALAVILSRFMDSNPDPKELAALSRELRATLADLAKLEAPGAKGGTVDDLNARRQARRKTG
jgi:hypothetical protein